MNNFGNYFALNSQLILRQNINKLNNPAPNNQATGQKSGVLNNNQSVLNDNKPIFYFQKTATSHLSSKNQINEIN